MTPTLTVHQKAAFIHTPKRLHNEIFVHPTATKALFRRLFDEAKGEAWWEDDSNIGYVGNSDGIHYFQIIGYPFFAAVIL